MPDLHPGASGSIRASSQGAITVGDFTIPALTVRRAETTVELGSGQSFMIAGLMSNNAQSTIDKTPGAGDLPILGNLFRSRSFRRGETELVIIVTPYLVQPVDASQIKLPTDGFRAATELQSLLGFQDNDGVSGASRPVPTVAADAASPSVSGYDPDWCRARSQPDERSADAREASAARNGLPMQPPFPALASSEKGEHNAYCNTSQTDWRSRALARGWP